MTRLKRSLLWLGSAVSTPIGRVTLWGLFAFLFVSLLVMRNVISQDYNIFLNAGRNLILRDPASPLYQPDNGFYNPVWVAGLIAPAGIVPDRELAFQLWRAVQIAVLFGSGLLWLRRLPLSQRLLWAALGVVYFPAWESVEFGQVLCFMVMGYALLYRSSTGGSAWLLAPAVLLLTAKPNLAAVALAALGVHLFIARRFRRLAMLVGTPIAASAIFLVWYPGWIADWLASLWETPPGLFHEQTNFYQLAYTAGGQTLALLVGTPLFLACVGVALRVLRRGGSPSFAVPILSALSLLASPQVAYAYDLTLLLPAFWALAEERSTRGLALLFFLFPIAIGPIGDDPWAIVITVLAIGLLVVAQRLPGSLSIEGRGLE